MKTEAEINADIIKITSRISQKYPELLAYILEMPVTIPNVEFPEINVKMLSDYYDSLNTMMEKYGKNHSGN